MSDEELKLSRVNTNLKISNTYQNKSESEKKAIADKISKTKYETPEEIKIKRIESMKKNQNRKQMAQSQRKTLENREPKTCPYCELSTKNYSNYTRWHGDNCKNNTQTN
jgi:hypothetical protein